MSISLYEFNNWMNDTLRLTEMEPGIAIDPLHNGLQTSGKNEIHKIGFGVSASMRLFEMAQEEACDAIVVHHGLNMQKRNMDHLSYERFAYLIKNDISLWSAHYVLDAHPEYGNNVEILRLLGVQVTDPYPEPNGIHWGYVGEMQKPTPFKTILETLQPQFSETTVAYDFGPTEVEKIAVVSGKGAPRNTDMDWLIENEVDLYITGEAHEWNREFFRECSMNFIAGGHYNTEKFGVQAIHRVVDEKLDVKTTFLDLPNNV